MKWTSRINNICAKANKTIGFLKRNINISNKSIKEKAFKSLVRPIVEYASAAWNPHQKGDIQKLEMIQRRAARFVQNRYHNTSSVSDMIDQLEWPTLEERRRAASLSVMNKLMNNKLNIDTAQKLMPNERPSGNSNAKAVQIPACRTAARKSHSTRVPSGSGMPCPPLLCWLRVLNPSRLASVSKQRTCSF